MVKDATTHKIFNHKQYTVTQTQRQNCTQDRLTHEILPSDALILSSYTYGCQHWCGLNKTTLRHIGVMFTTFYRGPTRTRAQRSTTDGNWTHIDGELTMLKAARHNATTYLSIARLKYFSKLYTHCPNTLQHLFMALFRHGPIQFAKEITHFGLYFN